MISHHREQTSLLKTVGIVCKVRVNPLSLPLLFLFMLVSLFVQVIHATICQSCSSYLFFVCYVYHKGSITCMVVPSLLLYCIVWPPYMCTILRHVCDLMHESVYSWPLFFTSTMAGCFWLDGHRCNGDGDWFQVTAVLGVDRLGQGHKEKEANKGGRRRHQ